MLLSIPRPIIMAARHLKSWGAWTTPALITAGGLPPPAIRMPWANCRPRSIYWGSRGFYLHRLLMVPLLATLASPLAFPQAAPTDKLGQLDGSPTMFAVFAAINAAGYDDQVDSPSNSKLRRDLREVL